MVGPRLITPRERLGIIAAFVVLWLASTGALVFYVKRIDSNGHHTAHALQIAEGALRKAEGALVQAASQEASQRLAQIANCKRGNERTVSENRSQLADWQFFRLTAALIRASIAHPPPEPGVSRRDRRIGRQRGLSYVHALEVDTQQKVWRHLIPDCAYAIDHPAIFTLGPPVAFSHHPPSIHVLRLEPGE